MTPESHLPDYSLQSRLLIAFSVLLFVFLGFTGIVLDRAFRNSIEAGAADRLQDKIYLILAAVEEDAGEFYFLEDLQEPRFSVLNSGLYGFISQSSLGELWRSESARTFELPDSQVFRQRVAVGDSLFSRLPGELGEEYFQLSYGILWEDGISEYSFSVVENAAPYYSEISNFRNSLWSWLGGVAFLLLLIQFFLMRWGLSPLHRMAIDLKKIESGNQDKLEGSYPRELRGVADNLNLLIETERKQQSRYRTTLGDLAHSLKTPLAVVAGILPKINFNSTADVNQQLEQVNNQLERMNQIVTYQLQRAVQSTDASSLAKQVNVTRAVEKVVDALTKVYADKSIELHKELDKSVIFNGDERDLIEVLGNVLDNAFKYGSRHIQLRVAKITDRSRGLEIVVEDDGPGIPDDKQEYVLQRGARADTLVQGQGIGLAVVTDIVSSYSGDISVGRSKLGGARIRIAFKSP
ncbi:MAG: ATP-binding protein [Proteobacteria bacterium]|nr:ATP-binding protein [Pseudomonadota bacterium]